VVAFRDNPFWCMLGPMEEPSKGKALTLAILTVLATGSCGGGESPSKTDAGRPDGGVNLPAQEGRTCTAEGTLLCGQNANAMSDNVVLYCSGGVYHNVFQCPDSAACANITGHDLIRCGAPAGTYFAQEGTACANESSQACSFDQSVVLKCIAGTWVVAIHCSPSTCANLPQTSTGCSGTWCANCGYTPGDMCDLAAGTVRCSPELSKIVQCSAGTVTVWRDCGSGQCTSVESKGTTTLDCQ
jgi:hypothetical protein